MRRRTLTGLLLLVACGPGSEAGPHAVREPLPGGGERVINPKTGTWPPGGGWRVAETLRIGSQSGGGPDAFGRLSALAVDGAGRVWLIEAMAREVRVFDAGGVHVRTFGREGAGPGEFRRPGGLIFDPAGDLWIPDTGNGRYARWDTAGTERETRRMETAGHRFHFVGTMTAEGVLWDVDLAPPEPGEAATSPLLAGAGLGGRELLRPVLRTDGAAVQGEPLAVPGGGAPEVFSAPGLMLGVPFTPAPKWRVTPDGAQWFGTSDAYRIVRRTFAGDTTLIVERSYDPLPVTAAEVEAWLAGAGPLRVLERGGSIDRSRIPPTKPIFDDLLVDDAGHLWVRLVTEGQGTTFDVFDPRGVYLGAVVVPERIALTPRPVVRDGMLYAVVPDSLDVPYVVGWQLAVR